MNCRHLLAKVASTLITRGYDEEDTVLTTGQHADQRKCSLYNTPITLSDTTMVKAIAIKVRVSISVTEHTFTKFSGDDEGADVK